MLIVYNSIKKGKLSKKGLKGNKEKEKIIGIKEKI